MGINRHAQKVKARIQSNRRIGVYHQIVIEISEELVKQVKPGNFITVAVGGEASRMILQRAFAISRTSDRGTVELIVAPHGSGSRWLCAQNEGTELEVVLPLGIGFGIPTEPINCLLVGGGYGAAPLFGLAEELKERGCRVFMLLGASTSSKIYAPLEGKRAANILKICTEDGSAGDLGRVTDQLPELVKEHAIDVIYSCGPMPMLSAISELASSLQVVHQCAVEEAMACGIGICMTCVLPVADSAGHIRNLRSCIDGPVMDGASVQWQLVGKQL